mmetsp:Transcript_19364/g.23904  ORF Transcript_19364/g.23904 Transcript_19364/m.23904 type:complete len:159 (+) Transcript_19364:146-622(+)
MFCLLVLLQCHQWELITLLIKFQASTPLNQLMIKRDEHFKREWRTTKFFIAFVTILLLGAFAAIVATVFETSDYVFKDTQKVLFLSSTNFFLLTDLACVATLAVCAARVAITAFRRYNYGYHKYKGRFTVILLNMLMWSVVALIRDVIFNRYETCIFM